MARRGKARRGRRARRKTAAPSSTTKRLGAGSSRRSRRKARRAARGGGRRSGPSGTTVRRRSGWEQLLFGGLSALGFGLLQWKVRLPGIRGVPNSLTYGTALTAVGVLVDWDPLLKIGLGPTFAGLHNLGLKGFTAAEQVSGEFDSIEGDDESTEGEFDQLPESTQGELEDVTEGEFEEIAAGDFDDI